MYLKMLYRCWYLCGTLAQFDNLEQTEILHIILLMVAIYPTSHL